MSSLSVTLIDVGWGDSILIESMDSNDVTRYAMVDSNDTMYFRSSYIFLDKYFEKKNVKIPDAKPVFEFVLLSHAHSDHGQGLKAIMKDFGTKNFWYPKSLNWSSLATLIDYANRSTNVKHHESLDTTKVLPDFGDVKMIVLWPSADAIDTNENNNSVVIKLKLDNSVFMLTGDAEAGVWDKIASQIPIETQFFKVPHHGSINGTFDQLNNTPWASACPPGVELGISSHVRPYSHPDQKVIDLFQTKQMHTYRTDQHYHVTFSTDGSSSSVKYSHI
ncbi:MAG TPA: hypothetical protein VF399_09900 [bacterium]